MGVNVDGISRLLCRQVNVCVAIKIASRVEAKPRFEWVILIDYDDEKEKGKESCWPAESI